MLTEKDVDWIKSNRDELTQQRTEKVTVHFQSDDDGDEDPYTGETESAPDDKEVEVVWKDQGTERLLEDGIKLEEGDVKVSFEHDVDVYNIDKLTRQNVDYKLTNIDEKGLGEPNRFECVAKKVK